MHTYKDNFQQKKLRVFPTFIYRKANKAFLVIPHIYIGFGKESEVLRSQKWAQNGDLKMAAITCRHY